MVVGLLLFSGCGSRKPVEETPIANPVPDGIVFVEMKFNSYFVNKDNVSSLTDAIEAYAVTKLSDTTFQDFRKLCIHRKSDSNVSGFHNIILFDKTENATFGPQPFLEFTALEESYLNRVLAIYGYNKSNGFSELQWASPNLWEGKPNRERL